MPSDIAEAFYGAGYTVLDGFEYDSSSTNGNIITVIHTNIEKRVNLFGEVKLVKVIDECKIEVSIDRHWTYADYYYAGVNMRDDLMNAIDTVMQNDTVSMVINVMSLCYSFIIDPIVELLPRTTKKPTHVLKKYGKRSTTVVPF